MATVGYDYDEKLRSISDFESRGNTLGNARDHSEALSQREKYQLCMSRFLTGGDACVAIYDAADGKCLVSNNSGNQNHFNEVKAAFEEFNTEGFDEAALRRRMDTIFRGRLESYTTPRGRGIASRAEAMVDSPEVGRLKEYQGRNLKDDLDVLIAGFNEYGRDIVDRMEFVDGSGTHAEMKLLPYAIRDVVNERSDASTTASASAGFSPSIITSKLMCNPCDLVINAVGEKPLGIAIRTIGTHGKSYPGWRMPDLMPACRALGVPAEELAFIEGLEAKVKDKLRVQSESVEVLKKGLGSAAVVEKSDDGLGDWVTPKASKAQIATRDSELLKAAGAEHVESDAPVFLRNVRSFRVDLERSASKSQSAPVKTDVAASVPSSLASTPSRTTELYTAAASSRPLQGAWASGRPASQVLSTAASRDVASATPPRHASGVSPEAALLASNIIASHNSHAAPSHPMLPQAAALPQARQQQGQQQAPAGRGRGGHGGERGGYN